MAQDLVSDAIGELKARADAADAGEDQDIARTETMRLRPSSTPTASSTSRLFIRLRIDKRDDSLVFDFSKSSPPCRGPMNSVLATTQVRRLSRHEAYFS